MNRKKIILFGSSGFIGSNLKKILSEYEVKCIKSASLYELSPDQLAKMMDGFDLIINLSGASVFARWTKSRKRKIYESRILITRKIVQAMAVCNTPPARLLNASAVGIYAANEKLDENSTHFSKNFLSKVVQEWENEARDAEIQGIKVAVLRFGIVLGKEGGAYQKMRNLVKFNLGAYFGKGNQYLPFVAINDLTKAIIFIIENNIHGTVNITAPDPSTYKEFVVTLKKKLKADIIWSIPKWFIKIAMGEASVIFLEGQNVNPGVLTENNFKFEACNINQCIDIIEAN
jgi:uncharacterized protein (TIGR01777 family)